MDKTWQLSLQQETEIERALARMGLAVPVRDPLCWESLRWFVEFAQRDLGTATEGDWLQLQEEIDALLHLTTHQRLRSPFNHEHVHGLQKEAFKILGGLVSTDEAHIGKFQVTVAIRRGTGNAGDSSQIKRFGPMLAFPAGRPIACLIGPDGFNGLVYYLATLLMRFPDVVQRCPNCTRLFARLRRHAKYCGRICQSRVAAQKNRDEDRKQRKQKEKTKRQNGMHAKRRTTKKGVSR